MATKIQLRRDTSTNWEINNPVLASGEVAFSIDLGKIKIGNGTANWQNLSYAHLTPTEISASYQPLGADLTAISQLSGSGYLQKIGEDTWSVSEVSLGTDTAGNYVETIVSGNGISISGEGSESASVTIENTGVLSLSGTSDEINVSSSVGSITLSLPETINADTTGTAASATYAVTAGTANSVAADSVALGSDTTGDYVARLSASGDGLSLSGSGESASVTISNTGVTSLTGTENEIEVSASTGSITLSLPETINANTTGSAATLTNSRAISLSGDLSGSATFNGSENIDISTTIQPDSVALGTDTTGNYVQSVSASGGGISVTGTGEGATVVVENTGVHSLLGTASQINVSASNGDITLSLPSAVTFPGTVSLNGAPTQALHAATKQYVDEVVEGLKTKPAVQISTTASLDASYDNGTDGVGATLTANSNGAFPEIDGVTLTSTTPGENGILVKNQSNAAHNGRYNLTQVGDGSNPWILTRCGLCDESDEIPGMYVFVKDGTLGEGTGWVATVNDPSTFVIGTDDINYQQFSGAGTYTAGTGLSLDGTSFSNTGVLSLAGTSDEVEVSASSGNITISLPTTINANTTGSAATLTSSRTIELTGDVTGSASFDGSANASIAATIAPDSVALGTDTTGNYVATITGTTNQISVAGSGSEDAAITLSLPSTINVDTSGNAATATKLATARAITLTGDATGTANFDGSASAGIAVTLEDSGVSASTYGSSTSIPVITVDSKGRLTGVTTENIVSLPEQSGNSGKYLTTDGTNASWSEVDLGFNPFLLAGM